MIHVMAVAGLAGSAVATAVMGDDSIAVIEKEQHLRVPVVGRQRPAMAEHDRLTVAPILVVNFDAVFGVDRGHGRPPFFRFLDAVFFHRHSRTTPTGPVLWPARSAAPRRTWKS